MKRPWPEKSENKGYEMHGIRNNMVEYFVNNKMRPFVFTYGDFVKFQYKQWKTGNTIAYGNAHYQTVIWSEGVSFAFIEITE